MDREEGNKEKMNVESEYLSISSFSLHFLSISSFSLHFLFIFSFSLNLCSPDAWFGIVWKSASPIDGITMGQSTTIFLCIRPFSAW